jgi:hypothetical protein
MKDSSTSERVACLPGVCRFPLDRRMHILSLLFLYAAAESLSCRRRRFLCAPRNETLNIQTATAACLLACLAGWRIMNMTFYVSKHNNATQCHISFKTSHLLLRSPATALPPTHFSLSLSPPRIQNSLASSCALLRPINV